LNDRGIYRWNGSAHELLARAAVNAAPGGGFFDQFQFLTIGNAGEVVVRGTTDSAAQRLWRFPVSGGGSVVASTGTIDPPGVLGATMASINPAVLYSSGGVAAYNGILTIGPAVTIHNDRGVWLDVAGAGELLVRESLSPVPGIDGAQFASPNVMGVNNQAQTAVLGALVVDGAGGSSSSQSLGIWRLSPSGGELIARRSSGGVAGVAAASYSALGDPTINSAGQLAFAAQLEPGGGITESNNDGIWMYDGSANQLVARSGSEAPGAPGAQFATFNDPLLNDSGQILVHATLAAGAGGVNPGNADGLWTLHPGGGGLVARSGAGGVPGVAGANFASFESLAFNDAGTAAMRATLAVGPGGVTSLNNEGIWLLDPMGESLLVARSGDAIGGRTIASLDFTGGSAGGDGRGRSLNSNDQLVFKAVFTNGDEGLILFSRSVAGPAADFTLDGSVDGADLARWKINFGQAAGAGRAQGDADADGDVDGSDFLLWQQQLSVSFSSTAVPEPSIAITLLPASLAAVLRCIQGDRHLRRRRRQA
jgi:hypothetical protein